MLQGLLPLGIQWNHIIISPPPRRKYIYMVRQIVGSLKIKNAIKKFSNKSTRSNGDSL